MLVYMSIPCRSVWPIMLSGSRDPIDSVSFAQKKSNFEKVDVMDVPDVIRFKEIDKVMVSDVDKSSGDHP